MAWNTIFGFIDPKLIIVVAACWVIGFVLKLTPKIPDWSIVYIVTISALLMATGLLGWSTETFIQGLLCGSFAVYGHQVVKQASGRDHNE